MARGDLQMAGEAEAERDEVDSALAAFGLYLDEGSAELKEPREWHLWPDCLPAFELFLAAQTQMVVTMGGPVGLSYPGVESLLRLRGLSATDRRQRFAELQHIESGWLEGWREKNDKQGDNKGRKQ